MKAEQMELLVKSRVMPYVENNSGIWAHDLYTGSTLLFGRNETPKQMAEHIEKIREKFKCCQT